MPYWLHNTLFVFLLIITFGCVSSGIKWKTKEDDLAKEQ